MTIPTTNVNLPSPIFPESIQCHHLLLHDSIISVTLLSWIVKVWVLWFNCFLTLVWMFNPFFFIPPMHLRPFSPCPLLFQFIFFQSIVFLLLIFWGLGSFQQSLFMQFNYFMWYFKILHRSNIVWNLLLWITLFDIFPDP